MKKVGIALALFVVGVVAVGGCKTKKKAGDSCTGEEATCLDKTAVLECHNGKFAQMACKGPKGCAEKLKGATTSGRTVTHNYSVECDFTGNAVGEECTEDGSLCSADKKSMYSCKSHKIVVVKCLGAKGCVESNQIECDTTIQTAGEACEGEDVACTPDKKQFLVCKGGKFELGENCRGAKGCTVDGQKIGCDSGDQNKDDPCASDGNYACAADKKALLKCKGTKWAIDQKCRKTCITRGNEVGCQ